MTHRMLAMFRRKRNRLDAKVELKWTECRSIKLAYLLRPAVHSRVEVHGPSRDGGARELSGALGMLLAVVVTL